MMLTPRDLDILDTLQEVKFLTIDQMTRLFFPSSTSCRNRLLLLRREKWLEEDRPRPFHLPNFSILKLGKNAYKYFGYRAPKKAPTVYLEHRLELNDLYVHLRNSSVLKDLNLEWQDGANFELLFLESSFKPDARMISKSETTIYLEYDRGTKNFSVIQENISKYLHWMEEQKRWKGSIPKTHLIYVTPKDSRALGIQKQFEIACSKQDSILLSNIRFHSLTTEAFLEQSKMILNGNKGQSQLVNEEPRQTNQLTF